MKRTLSILLCAVSLLQAELVREYFENGKLKSEAHYIDGTRTKTKEGIKHGMEKVYYIEGALAYSVNYVNGKRDGVMIWWDKDGNIIKELHYNLGKLDGWEITYFPNGKIKSKVLYKNDLKEGLYKEFFDNGQLALIVPYKHGKKEGIQREYSYSGKLYTEVLYKNNYKEGTQKWFDDAGNIVKTEEFVHDRPLRVMQQLQQSKHQEPNILLKGLNFSPNRPQD